MLDRRQLHQLIDQLPETGLPTAARYLQFLLAQEAPVDQEMLARAFQTFQRTEDRPTLIIVDSHIAYGAPNKQDTSAAHGEPLGDEEIRLTKKNYGWPEDARFLVPEGVREHFQEGIGKRGKDLRERWHQTFQQYAQQYPELATHVGKMQRRDLPDGWDRLYQDALDL